MNALIDLLTAAARRYMQIVAKILNKVSGGRISPDFITLTSLVMHVPIAALVGFGYLGYAAVLLVVFGLFDALDGALAKVQNRAGSAGMLLDASTDRMKEVLLYTGIAYLLAQGDTPSMAAWAVAALGASLCVSYVKAKGETAVKDTALSPNEVNRLFGDGVFRFQVRIALLLTGLLFNQVLWAVIIIALGSTVTAVGRLYMISRKL